MKVRWSKRALAQLRAAHDHIKNDNPSAATEFVEATNSLVDLLAQYPGMGVPTSKSGVVMFPLVRYRYLVFYKILNSNEIRIIRVRHASRRRPR